MFNPDPIADNDAVIIVDPLDTEAVKKSIDTVSAQKKHWREKALDPTTGKTYKELYEAKVKELTVAPTNKPDLSAVTPTSPGTTPPSSPDADWLFDNIDAISTLTPDERTELRTTAKELNVEPVKYIKSKAGQAHLKDFRSTKKTQTATPSPANSVPSYNGKPVRDVFLDEKATSADKQAAYESRLKGIRGANQAV